MQWTHFLTKNRVFLTAVISALTLILGACQNPSRPGGSSTTFGGAKPGELGPSQSPTGTPPPSGPKGTADTGGGNGLNGKMLETYQVDPRTLPAYRKYVSQIFDKYDKEYAESPWGKHEQMKLFDAIVQMRTWYIVPKKLETIGKEVLGVLFFKDSTDQLAIQTDMEIYIDKSYFDNMSDSEQADLIEHEVVMTAYFIGFMKMPLLCKRLFANHPKVSCENVTEDMMPGKPKRPLNEDDYKNIRRAVAQLKHNYQTMTLQHLFYVLVSLDFDNRLFGASQFVDTSLPEHKSKMIDNDQILALIEQEKILNTPLTHCYGRNERTKGLCTFHVTPRTEKEGAKGWLEHFNLKQKLDLFQASASVSGSSTPSDMTSILGPGYFSVGYSLPYEKPEIGKILRYINFVISVDKTRAHWETVDGKSTEQKFYRLEAVVISPTKVVRIERVDGKRRAIIGRPAPATFAEDTIVIVKPGQEALAEKIHRWDANMKMSATHYMSD
jgi:hypothetical protein